PDADIPVGGEEANQTLRSWGAPLPHQAEGWVRQPHWDLIESLRLVDNARGAKVAGSGFPVYTGLGARLQRSLVSWFLDTHVAENGFTEIWPPAVVNAD